MIFYFFAVGFGAEKNVMLDICQFTNKTPFSPFPKNSDYSRGQMDFDKEISYK